MKRKTRQIGRRQHNLQGIDILCTRCPWVDLFKNHCIIHIFGGKAGSFKSVRKW